MLDIRAELRAVLENDHPMTVRQVFYQLVTKGVIDKTEAAYKGTVCRVLADMRRDGSLPYEWIADSTRWMRRGRTNTSLADALTDTQMFYRRDIWAEQDCYVEVWLEKEALAGVLFEVTDKWHVPLMVTRGYSSLSFLHMAAEAIASQRKPSFLYYFGDLDPSGVDITRAVEQGIRRLAPGAEIHFERVGVTREQVRKYQLQTRPTKRSDSRSKTFKGESVEVDAIPSAELRDLCEDCIVSHIDTEALMQMRVIESEERRTLDEIVRNFGTR